MTSRLIKILLVDDHLLVRKGIKMIIETEKTLKVIDEANNGNEAIEKALLLKPDLVLMDINMPDLNGLDTLRKMKEVGLKSNIIILTGQPNKEGIISATKMGARGYLSKDCEPSSLIKAIFEVSRGQSYLDLKVINLLQGKNKEKKEMELSYDKIGALSKREYEVLMLLVRGLNNKMIGFELYISEKTVKNHITQIYKKLEVSDRLQAALFAYNNIK